MRNKSIEAGLILAVATFTMLSVGTYISDLNANNGGQPFVHIYHRVQHWFTSRATNALSNTTNHSAVVTTLTGLTSLTSPLTRGALLGNESGTPRSSQQTLNQLIGSTGPVGTGVINSANDARMLQIAQSLAQNLTAADWTKMMSLLQSSHVSSAQTQLASLLESKLSPSDAAWLSAHFQGKQAFDRTDVVLLQQTLNELKHMFTPAEQKMLQQQLKHYGVALNG